MRFIERMIKRLKLLERWVLLATLVGIVSGVGAVIFYVLLELSVDFFLEYIVNYTPPAAGGEAGVLSSQESTPRWWMLPFVPMIGGIISGILVYTWAPEAEGHGTDAVISAFHRFKGHIRKRIPLIKTLSSVAIIGSGGSAGREGPIAQIGAGFGSWLSSLLNLSDRDRRIAVICGTAGGIGSIFKAPLGGAVFAIEVLYKRDFEAEALIPSFISSTIAYSIFALFFGFDPIFDTPMYALSHVAELIFYAILGIICAPLAIIYVKMFYWTRDNVFKKLDLPNHMKPALGGLGVGILALLMPEILGSGYGWIQLAMHERMILVTMIALIFAKMLATALTIGSGGSGGVFAPSLVIGAMIGGAFGTIIKLLFPDLPINPGAFVLVGMAAFFSGAAKVPVASIIMISEMTGDYNLLAPLMIACALSYIFSGDWTIYESQVLTKAHSPVHRGEFTVDILEKIGVGKVMTRDVITVSPETTIHEISELIGKTGHLGFPVVKDSKLVGIITYADVIKVPVKEAKTTKAEDIMTRKLITVTPKDNLCSALRKMHEYKHGHLPVVDSTDKTTLVGIITKSDIIRGHEIIRRITRRKEKETETGS